MLWIVRKYAGMPITRRYRRLAAEFLAQADRAAEVQRARLLELVRRNAESDFGRDHGFAEIRSPADFRRLVPIRGYDGHEPYIARVRAGETSALFGPGAEVLMFALTSGTTAKPKTIPVTRESLADYKEGWSIWGMIAFDDHPGILARGLRPILQLVSNWRESFTTAGIPCGAITGLTAQMQNPLVRQTYVMPPATMRIAAIEAKYYAALRLSVHRNLGTIMAANPATLLAIARLGDRVKETLIRDVADGTISDDFAISADIRAALRFRTRFPRRRAARRLDAIVARTGRLLPKDYWPNLEFLANWTGGTMGAYLSHYPEYFGTRPIRDIGLIASEGRFTIPIEDDTPGGLLDIRHHYYEFIPEDQADRESPETVEAADLIEGRNYFILPTTSGGLYRYQIHDLVRCLGFRGTTPILAFLNKGAHYSSLSGEKLSEFQAVAAVDGAVTELGLRLKSYLLAPTWGEPPFYSLLVERDDLPTIELGMRLAAAVDARLQSGNCEYENRRGTNRLGPVALNPVVEGSWSDFQKRRLAASGGTMEQYKQPCLIPDLKAVEGFRAAEPEILPAGGR